MSSAAPALAVPRRNLDLYLALGLVGVLIVMILPLPRFVMDLGLSLSICISLVTFLVAIYLRDPLDLSTFPSLILIATLLRLALNVASTRLILLHGPEGASAAGAVIRAFGQFVVGGNYAVGLILFLILVVINFVVITKGAGRVAEVSARFTLDAMPGKQMAIDADLGAGLITELEAHDRRKRIQEEADFHGSMDGASKFVRGDAIAGLVITAINVVAGVGIGTVQHSMPLAEAAETFTTLTVGDGLVSQIPALLVSTAAGIIVTRAAGETDLGTALIRQLTHYRRPSAITAGVLGALALVPGMPHLTFFLLAAGAGSIAAFGPRVAPREEGAAAGEEGEEAAQQDSLERLLPIDLLALEVGYEVVTLVDSAREGNLLTRIAGIRRQIATELGVVVPPIHLRDNLQLQPGEYRLLLLGNEVGRGDIRVGGYLAMDPAGVSAPIDGEQVTEPAFGLPARWITPADRALAETLGYTVVDPTTVVATHLGELVRQNAHELLGRAEAQQLLDIFAKTNPSLVEELIPSLLPLGEVIKVLRRLLQEGVSIRDLRTILETLADHAGQTKDPATLTELVRQRMAKHLTARVRGADGRVHALLLDRDLEQGLIEAARQSNGSPIPFEGHALHHLLPRLQAALERVGDGGEMPVLVVAPEIRPLIADFIARHAPGLPVYSYREIEPKTPLNTLGVVGGPE